MYLSFRIYYAFKTIGIKAYVLGGLYLAFLEMLKIKMFLLCFWWSVPLFLRL